MLRIAGLSIGDALGGLTQVLVSSPPKPRSSEVLLMAVMIAGSLAPKLVVGLACQWLKSELCAEALEPSTVKWSSN